MRSGKLFGRLIHWKNTYGFAEIRDPKTGELNRFFIHQRFITKQVAETISRGAFVTFTVDPNFKPSHPGELPCAKEVEIWPSLQQTSTPTADGAK